MQFAKVTRKGTAGLFLLLGFFSQCISQTRGGRCKFCGLAPAERSCVSPAWRSPPTNTAEYDNPHSQTLARRVRSEPAQSTDRYHEQIRNISKCHRDTHVVDAFAKVGSNCFFHYSQMAWTIRSRMVFILSGQMVFTIKRNCTAHL